jgi:NAD(P)-dependent dehydrogenase (short-subunit alcohol dehydrogenase family)
MICVVTGATSGIGKETAVALAKAGATVAVVCRTRERGERALAEITRRSGSAAVSLFIADLSSRQAVKAVAAKLHVALPRLDVLVNNAGLALRDRIVTGDGFESTFAVNHLAYFLLTRLLGPKLVASAPRGSSTCRRRRIAGVRSGSTTSWARSSTTDGRPTPSRSSPTSCSPTSWRDGWRAPG